MNMTELITRRRAAGLLLAGAAGLPAVKAFGSHQRGVDASVRVSTDGVVTVFLVTFSGQTLTAVFASELRISSRGAAEGFMRFGFGGDDIVDYVAGLGGLDFDDAGDPIRAWFLMELRGSNGHLALDYLLGSVELDAPATVHRYLIYAHGVHVEPVQFEAPGEFEILKR